MTEVEPDSWHHGLVARWWAYFAAAGPEIAYIRGFVEAGEPALDVACGTGRLLVPYVEAGLDVDGVDVSADMVAWCTEAARRVGAAPRVSCQAMHELDLPRRYRTVYVCGGLGLGSTRRQDAEALRRILEHLEPGGTLVLDHEVPYTDPRRWGYWAARPAPALPEPDEPPEDRRTGPDGCEYAVRTRMLALDPVAQQEAWEIRARQWRDGVLVAEERHRLTANQYFPGELVLMLEGAGFTDVRVRGGYEDRDPTPEDDVLVYVATRP